MSRLEQDLKIERQTYIRMVYLILCDASESTVDPHRAMDIAQRAVEEACDNREGK